MFVNTTTIPYVMRTILRCVEGGKPFARSSLGSELEAFVLLLLRCCSVFYRHRVYLPSPAKRSSGTTPTGSGTTATRLCGRKRLRMRNTQFSITASSFQKRMDQLDPMINGLTTICFWENKIGRTVDGESLRQRSRTSLVHAV